MVLQADADKLRQTNDTVDRDAFQAAVNAILGARRIYLLGVRSASVLVNFLGYYLNYMFDNVHVITSSGGSEMLEKLIHVRPDDVVLAISFPRYSTSTIKGVQYCRQTGATVVGLTNGSLSPLAQICDHTLIAKSDMVSFVDSLVAPLSVLNALLVALASGKKDVVQNNLDNLERVWDTYNVYEKRNDV
jgi:DNA-binding MurR/RpiR family transcriptional regulator